ncbi:hypothetical protein [Nonomuraea candida]|uniref:hypothetical protein n=1 Tax=Nonomuraea candida TaxID=359159 RepID=UPI0005B84AFC|nr:hypothetical protein [Nonomuraea candida]
MDVEAEILNLRRRMQALEAGAPSDQRDDELDAVPESTLESERPGRGKATVAELQREMADDLEALSVEITGLRWQANDYYASGHSQLLDRLDDIRSGLHHLDLKLDQLLRKDAV